MRRFVLKIVFTCILVLGCSKDEIEEVESPNFAEPKNLYQANIITTITNFYGRDMGTTTYKSASLKGTWDHEYDEQGRLIKSNFFESFPFRRKLELQISNYSEDNLKANLQVTSFNFFEGIPSASVQNLSMQLNEDYFLYSLTDEEGNSLTFDEHNTEGWVTRVGLVVNGGIKVKTTVYEYDESGNVINCRIIHLPSQTSHARMNYLYTSFGDPKSYEYRNKHGNYSKVEYHYRQDRSLEKFVEEFHWGTNDSGTRTYYYDESEAFVSKEINYSDGRKEEVAYMHNEGKIIEEYYNENGLLSEIYRHLFFTQFGRYFLSTHETYLEGMISSIKYYDIDNDLLREEFYDENGVLDYTDYYDENGNYSHTEDA